MVATSTDPSVVKTLVVALCVAVSVIVALVAGILSVLAGAGTAAAVTQGGAAFGGSFLIALTLVSVLGGL